MRREFALGGSFGEPRSGSEVDLRGRRRSHQQFGGYRRAGLTASGSADHGELIYRTCFELAHGGLSLGQERTESRRHRGDETIGRTVRFGTAEHHHTARGHLAEGAVCVQEAGACGDEHIRAVRGGWAGHDDAVGVGGLYRLPPAVGHVVVGKGADHAGGPPPCGHGGDAEAGLRGSRGEGWECVREDGGDSLGEGREACPRRGRDQHRGDRSIVSAATHGRAPQVEAPRGAQRDHPLRASERFGQCRHGCGVQLAHGDSGAGGAGDGESSCEAFCGGSSRACADEHQRCISRSGACHQGEVPAGRGCDRSSGVCGFTDTGATVEEILVG